VVVTKDAPGSLRRGPCRSRIGRRGDARDPGHPHRPVAAPPAEGRASGAFAVRFV